ncbi:unnamed protein product [Kuraishia capsulata CBS 1993]|uniref:SMP-30/Gluconolactonase/LRE-like region domain-containing protein n=1 Tax=Kuraishia capsulata CBS 1993 TaxID=1382522 RepID=W6MJ64_9ASCO|nr:uncharacterized protein KUCA_T00002252001 [Kuraishia capsulata CBS 1993]CDK26281.1 unnamed protein product [Kuraishia capsulata CBS 1993]
MTKQTVVTEKFLSFDGSRLSEGVTYNPSNHTLLWLDVIAGEIHRVFLPSESLESYGSEDLIKVAETHEIIKTGSPVGVIGLTSDDDVLIAGCKEGAGFASFKTKTFEYKYLFETDPEVVKNMRSNDGSVDKDGNFWVGTMNDFSFGSVTPTGKLYKISAKDDSVTTMISEATIPNGLGWFNGKMYWTDSLTFTIWKFDYDFTTGKLSNREPHIKIKEILPGYDSPEPDGFCMTETGDIFTAVWSTSRVLHFNPAGELVEEFVFPAARISCVTFGGKDFDELFVTSADLHLDEPELVGSVAGDLGGSIFRVKLPGVKGQKKNIWKGKI